MNKLERLEAKVAELARDIRASLETAGIPSPLVAGLEPRKLAEVARALVPALAKDARNLDVTLDDLAEERVRLHATRIGEVRAEVTRALETLRGLGVEALEFAPESPARFTVAVEGARYRVLPDSVRPI
jgi:hypothetical protein